MALNRSRPIAKWKARDAEEAFLIGWVGTARLPEDGFIHADRISWYAAVFAPSPSRPFLWRCSISEGLVSGGVQSVIWGYRSDIWAASEDARAWVMNAGKGEFGGMGTVGKFEQGVGGVLRPTLRAVPDAIWSDGDLQLWDKERGRPVEPGYAESIASE